MLFLASTRLFTPGVCLVLLLLPMHSKYGLAEFQPAKNEVGRVIRYKFAFRWCEEQVSYHFLPYTGC
jgi:hypothetical protein